MPKKSTTSKKQSPASTDTVTESSDITPKLESESPEATGKNKKGNSGSLKKSVKPKGKRTSTASSETDSIIKEIPKDSVSKKTAKKAGAIDKEKSTSSHKKTFKEATLPPVPEGKSDVGAGDSTSLRHSNSAKLNITDEVIRYRAYLLSEQRRMTGHAGSPERDWEAAKQQLFQEALAQRNS